MGVLTFVHGFASGGVERVAVRLVRHWRRLGIDAPLLVGRDEEACRDDVAGEVEYSMPRPWGRLARRCETLWMILHLWRFVRRERPDVLFCPGNTYTVVAVVLRLMMGNACPPIVAKVSNDLARDDLPAMLKVPWQLWLRCQARFIAHWILIDGEIAADFAAHIGDVPRSVIPNPVLSAASFDQRLVKTHRVGSGRRFVAIGRLVRQKNYPLMLRAFAAGARPEDRLTIFGDGSRRGRLIRLASRLGVEKQVQWRGHVANAGHELVAHDFLLMTSRYEGVPAALAEALAAGIGVVATDCGPGVRGLAKGGALARLVSPDVGAFAAAIETATSPNDTDREDAIAHARRYAMEEVGSRYLGVFATCASTVKEIELVGGSGGERMPLTHRARVDRLAGVIVKLQ